MMTDLHTINRSPYSHEALQSCLRVAVAGSAIVLYEDGVYAAVKCTQVAMLLQQALDKHEVYALQPDMQARGIDPQQLLPGIMIIGYPEFVELSVQRNKVQAWC